MGALVRRRGGPDRDPAHPARRRAHAGVHAGGHPRRGAHPRHRRPGGPRRRHRAGQHVPPGAPAGCRYRGRTGRSAPDDRLDRADAHRFRWVPGVLARPGRHRGGPAVPLHLRRVHLRPDARVVGGGAGTAGGGHRHGPRRAGRAAGAAPPRRGGFRADAALGGAIGSSSLARRPGPVRDRPGRHRARPAGTLGGARRLRSGSTGTPSAGWRSGRLPRSATLPSRPSSASSPTTPPAT